MTARATGDPGSAAIRPGLRPLAAALVGLEALLLLAAAGYVLLELVRGTAGDLPSAAGLGVLAAMVGAALACCARGLVAGRRWCRAPILTWQFIQAGVGMPLSTSAYWFLGVPLLGLTLAVGVLVAGRLVLDATDA